MRYVVLKINGLIDEDDLISCLHPPSLLGVQGYSQCDW